MAERLMIGGPLHGQVRQVPEESRFVQTADGWTYTDGLAYTVVIGQLPRAFWAMSCTPDNAAVTEAIAIAQAAGWTGPDYLPDPEPTEPPA